VIVRLMGEGQWEVDDGVRARIDELDADTERAVSEGDEHALHSALGAMHQLVRDSGRELGDDHIGASDVVVPPDDLSIDEARELMHGEGLIPDLP
jgi:hypothetical protein